jgi:Glycosyltransferase family 92
MLSVDTQAPVIEKGVVILPKHKGESRLRWVLRSNRLAQVTIYLTQSLWCSNFGRLRRFSKAIQASGKTGSGVAVCARFRNEGPYLREWLDYHLAAGIEHFYLYESFSTDDYLDILSPYIQRRVVTLFRDWPHIPVSPAAEEHCLLNAMGRHEWLGFLDLDEFVVVRGNASIGAFLSEFRESPGVALHWRMFGSGGRKTRESSSVVASHTVRAKDPNRHVKCFVRPACVTQHRNPHSSYYAGMKCAVSELGRKVFGSLSFPATAQRAWINHYHCKSEEEYMKKVKQGNMADRTGMVVPNCTVDRMAAVERSSNEEFDETAIVYYRERCKDLGIKPTF